MTPFEIIILGIIYTFCIAFSTETLMEEVDCGMFERFLLFILILLASPLFTISVIGMWFADIINKSIED